jgi:hypothetical protein
VSLREAGASGNLGASTQLNFLTVQAGSSAGADVAARSGNVLGLPYLSQVGVQRPVWPLLNGLTSLLACPFLQEHTASSKLVGKAFAFDQEYTKSILTPALPKSLRHDLSFASTPSTVLRKATTQLVQELQPEDKAVRILRESSYTRA